MKASLFFLVYLLGLGCVTAQEINCVEKQKEFSKFVNDGKYKQASEILPILRKKCAAQSEDLYTLGIKTLQYNVSVAAADKKETEVRDLMKFYDQYDANFPNNKNGNLVQKAMLLYDNKLGTDAEIYSFLNKAFTTNPDQFTTANSLFTYFKLYNENYRNKANNITLEQLLAKYNDVVVAIEKNALAHPDKAVEFANASRGSKALIKEFLIPESLIPMAEKNYEANKENTFWLEATAMMLSDKCAASPIFGKIATQLHQLKPTSQSAYHLGNYRLQNKNSKEAVAYFEQAATLATEPSLKAKIYYTAGTILSTSDKAKAKKMLNAAIENNAKDGASYIFLSNMYSNSAQECGATLLEQKAIYHLASLTANKAGQVEPRFRGTADKMMEDLSKNNPTKAQMDEIKKAGGKIKIDCWIDETVSF